MATPHGWTNHGQERGAMVLKPSAPQAKAMKLEKENKELRKQLDGQQETLEMLTAALRDKGILPEE